MVAQVTLRTARLLLRPFRRDDVDAFDSFARAESYLRHLGDHPEPDAFVANNVGVDGAWVIELDGRIVGSAFLGDELACLLDPDVHGMGVGTEAARAVIDDGFDRRGYAEVIARAAPDNEASRRGLRRVGFESVDDDTFRLGRDEWWRATGR